MGPHNDHSTRESVPLLLCNDVPVRLPLPFEDVLRNIKAGFSHLRFNISGRLLKIEIVIIGAPVKMEVEHMTFQVLDKDEILHDRLAPVSSQQDGQREENEENDQRNLESHDVVLPLVLTSSLSQGEYQRNPVSQ